MTLSRILSQSIIDMIWKEVLQPALEDAGIAIPRIDRTSLRWDMVDTAAHWIDDDGMERQVHVWINGDWPRFGLYFEGVVWCDDRDKKQRKYKFYPVRDSTRNGVTNWYIEVSGFEEDPIFILGPSKDVIKVDLVKLIRDLNNDNLENDSARTTDLPSEPSREGFREPEFR